MLFKKAFLAILAVLILHIIFLVTDAYWSFGQLDIPMHFFGGFAMGLLGLAIHHAVASRHHTQKSPWWYHALFVVGFAMLIGIGWEFYEFFSDLTLHAWFDVPLSQISLADTMGDFFLDFIGATVAFVTFKKEL